MSIRQYESQHTLSSSGISVRVVGSYLDDGKGGLPVPHGPFVALTEDGKVLRVAMYRYGEEVGMFSTFDLNGNCISMSDFRIPQWLTIQSRS